MAACAGTRRSDEPRTASAMSGERFCYNHHPDHREERRQSASRAASLEHSKVGQEIRDIRTMARGLTLATVSNDLHPKVRKELTNVVQLLQTYARLDELELTAGEKPKSRDVALGADIGGQVREWMDGEEERVREKEELADDLAAVMKAHGLEARSVVEAM